MPFSFFWCKKCVFYFWFFHFFALSHIIPIANLCDSRSCSFCFYFFKIGGGVGEEDAVQVIHFVLENLGEQAGSAAGKFFSFFIASFHSNFFGSCDCAEHSDDTKTAFSYSLLFLGNFRDFRIYKNDYFGFVLLGRFLFFPLNFF